MTKTHFSALCLIALFALGSLTGAAQNTPTPEKLSLIKEFLTITQATKGANDTSDLMMGLQAAETAKMIDSLIDDDKSMTAERKAELKKTVAESTERSSARMRDFFKTRLKFEEIIEQTAIPVYDKHFSADELRQLIAFYKTPVGKRMIEVTPQLTIELMTGMMEKMMPKLQEFMREAAEAELKILQDEKPDR